MFLLAIPNSMYELKPQQQRTFDVVVNCFSSCNKGWQVETLTNYNQKNSNCGHRLFVCVSLWT